tara:strand:- start:298 stop:711 length:414 start_codon:yes stop_codon:yes gene_type:complete
MIGLTAISGIIGSVGTIVDSLHTSDEERLEAKQKFSDLQASVLGEILEYQGELNKAKSQIITAEAKSDNFLTSTWRPMTMLIFVGLIVAHWFGFTAPNLSEAMVLQLFDIVKIGLGGYVVGRSVEKVVKAGGLSILK